MNMGNTAMGEGDSGKSGTENQDPNFKGYIASTSGKSVTTEGILNNNNLNSKTDVNRMEEDVDYIFNDPKRKRPNRADDKNPLYANYGLSKNLQAAGLQGGVCQES